jgi:exosome complex component RRP41
MADKNLLSQMLEHLVNDEQDKAEELFHEYVVLQSREIYESLIEADVSDEDEEEEVEESADEDKDDEESVEENFEDIAIEADAEANPFGGDAGDDLAGELDAGEEGDDMGEEPAEEGEAELFQDLSDIVDELQAKFNELKGIEGEEHGDDFGSDEEGEEKPKEEFELETVREYVEKVPAGHGAEKKGQAEKADNTTSPVAGKNDMGGTTANIAKAQEDNSDKGTAGGLLNNKPQENNAGNINVPGGKAGNAFTTKEPGHGAEKKGAAEQADNTASLFRSRK